MRKQFEYRLEELNLRLIKMGALCETAIARAVRALLNQDTELAQQVVEGDKEINHYEKEIESMCLKLLLQQQPVASDLRIISAALKMITDMERIGDQAEEIADIVTKADLSSTINSLHLKDMAMSAIKMVNESIDAFVKRDLTLAKAVILSDDIVDQQFITIRSELVRLIREDLRDPALAIDILMIAKYLERIADHATNIAEWVEFSITGVHKEE
ncbi:Phosphate-specific transport system accessory protein PhoU [bioreactor metagenome]|uniref:Phosphate-specific transport system accessory protein PhoU n=1 Tax=bioreactor metagenome TaxID=1076179 RepID=A0A644YWK4_9ZZZZ